jgi:hypothetical protein
MIISDRRIPKGFGHAPLIVLTLLVLAFTLAFLYKKWKVRSSMNTTSAAAVILCDAENRLGDHFISGGVQFNNGFTQSGARAYSGRYSSRLLPGSQQQFGMGIRVTDLQPGGLYQASVWRFQYRNATKSYLAAKSEGGKDPFYTTQYISSKKEDNGWEQLQLEFYVPETNPPDFTDVYVYSNGKDTVYFDDFQIELIGVFEEKDFEMPVLDIWLDKEAMEQLSLKRVQALREGILETGADDRVRGKLRWTGLEAPVAARFRLKGDWLDHLEPGKWSFRVELTGNQFWQGMQAFSLQQPGTRHFLHEWVLHECWRREDVLTTAYDFVQVRLNGERLGLYAVEEHFEKFLIERQGRREGPIMKFDEMGFWDGMRHQMDAAGTTSFHIQLPSSKAQHAAIASFEASRTAANPELAGMAAHAASLIEQFRSGQTPPSQVFDIDKIARFYAIADVMGADHSTAWHNLRFYYSPLTGRLEPVGFDGYGTGPSVRTSFMLQGEGPGTALQSMLFSDTLFLSSYISHLFHYSSPEYLNAFFEGISTRRFPRQIALLREYPDYYFQEQEFIQTVLHKRAQLLPQERFSFLARQSAAGAWELTNSHPYPLLLLGWSAEPQGAWTRLPQAIWTPGAPDRPLLKETFLEKTTIWPAMDLVRTKSGALQGVKEWPAPIKIDLPQEAKYLVYQLPGVDTLLRQELRPVISHADPTPRQELASRPFNINDPRWEVRDRQIRILPGKHSFTDWLVIPEGYTLEAGPGVALDFRQGAGFLSFSPLRFAGTAEEPILITSSDGTGRGLTVLAQGQASSLEHTVFERLKNLEWKGWVQTGAVVFVESSVRIKNCVFRHTRSEDALNLVRCHVDMSECLFVDAFSDGFDCDFCTGNISQTAFTDCRNDGLDFSGSRVQVKECSFNNCGDKGISVGEESDVACFDISLKNVHTGIAAKDRSVAVADRFTLLNCTTGFAVYQKKPESGPAKLVVREYRESGVGRLYRVQWGSALQLKDRLIRGDDDGFFE